MSSNGWPRSRRVSRRRGVLEEGDSPDRDRARLIKFTLFDGNMGAIPVEAIDHVSVLQDGRGVVYTKPSGLIVTRDGEQVLEQWLRLR